MTESAPSAVLPEPTTIQQDLWMMQPSSEPELHAGRELPKISIITVSYQQVDFLEQALRSVLMQGYPNLEYIVVDGGSKDGSKELIERYAEHLSWWCSEADGGQAEALNKGFAQATGDIVAWINSDDYLLPGALRHVAEQFAQQPQCQWLIGPVQLLHPSGELQSVPARWAGRDSLLRFWEAWEGGTLIWQQGSFWRREISPSPLLNDTLHYGLDYELWLRLSEQAQPKVTEQELAVYRFHDSSKTISEADNFLTDQLRVCRPYWQQKGLAFWLRCERAWRESEARRTLLSEELPIGRTIGALRRYPLVLLQQPVRAAVKIHCRRWLAQRRRQ